MPIKADIGISDKPDAGEALRHALGQACNRVKSPNLLIFFASARFDQKAIAETLKQEKVSVPFIGCSSAGEITNYGVSKSSIVVMAMSGDFEATTSVSTDISQSSRQAGVSLGQANKPSNKKGSGLTMILADILAGNGEMILEGFLSAASRGRIVFGAGASDDFLFKEAYVYGPEAMSGRAVGLNLDGDFTFGIGVGQGWIPIGLPIKVTVAHDAVVDRLNDRPAIEFYVDNFGRKMEDLKKAIFARLAITYPLGFLTPDGQIKVRYPLHINHEGGLRLTAGLPVGAEVRLMLGSREDAIKAAEQAAQKALNELKGVTPQAALVFSSVARNKLLAQYANDEIEKVKNIIGTDVPLIGFYSYGEYAPVHIAGAKSQNYFYNDSIVVVLFA